MNTKILSILAGFLLVPGLVFAQQGTVSGTVVDAQTEETLPGASVQIPAEGAGTATDAEGQFSFRVQPGDYTLEVSFVGYQTSTREISVSSGSTTQLRVQLEQQQAELDEVVVTGVASGTQTKKLGFSVGKVSEEALERVPATDPGNALRGKIAGAQVVQGSGDPASDPSIQLRGATTIEGNRDPLVIVDGVITAGGLKDISMQDVESIEVTKGAAASSLYGSLAGNGVIQITTKSGSDDGGLQLNVRSELGVSDVAGSYPSATRHPWQMNNIEVQLPNGDTRTVSGEQEVRNLPDGVKVLSWPGRSDEAFSDDRLFDNPFPETYDNIENAVTAKQTNTNYISAAGSEENFDYKVSFENYRQAGVLDPVNDYDRNTFRVKGDYTPDGPFSISANVSYVKASAPVIEEQGQGDNYFYSLLTADAYIDMTERNESGDYAFQPTGYDVQQSNYSNPFYVAQNRQWEFDRERLYGGVEVNYDILDNWTITGRQSIDREDQREEQFYPVGYQTPDDDPTLASGFDDRIDDQSEYYTSSISTQYSGEFQELAYTAVAKYLYENRTFSQIDLEGSGFPAQGIRNVGSLDPSTFDIGSDETEEKTENYFVNLDLDYQDTYILSGLVRRDGSSLFGSEERWQTYFRGSLAYRLTQDFDIPRVSELKLRGAYGTSGNRPPFEAQYETFTATSSGLQLATLGNSELRSSTIAETSLGIDATFLQRFTGSFTYALSQTKDDYLEVPLPGKAGFTTQYQNIGEVQSTSWEASLDGQILRGDGPRWNVGVTFSSVSQEITDLGNRPPFTRDLEGDINEPALSLFRVQEDVPFGAIYGNQLLTSLDQLTVVDGEVLNAGGSSPEDFEINDQGYVIPAGTQGTPQEQPVYMVNESGGTAVTQIGNTRPDYQIGLRSNFSWKGLNVYALVDWSQGGDVYNYSKQLMYFNYRHEDQQEFAEDGKDISYTDGSSNIYNQGAASSYFVEDGSFVKLREVSLGYTLDAELLQSALGTGAVNQVRFSLIGRNLFTLTDYSGWDPEVGLRSDANNFRLDEYAYPNFRTFTGSISLQF
jgi:TonB-linked SusC/RagA family outer membrane protein